MTLLIFFIIKFKPSTASLFIVLNEDDEPYFHILSFFMDILYLISYIMIW